jgi:hypothetical protein
MKTLSLIGNTTRKADIHENTVQTIPLEKIKQIHRNVFFLEMSAFIPPSTLKIPITTGLQKLNTQKTSLFLPFSTHFLPNSTKNTKKHA